MSRRYARLIAIATLIAGLSVSISAQQDPIAQSNPLSISDGYKVYEYRLLATNRTSRMQDEMNDAAREGYRFMSAMGGDTVVGGSEAVVVMYRDLTSNARLNYLLLATSRTGTLENELQAAGFQGYEYVGQTVFSTVFGGREIVAVLERDQNNQGQRINYKLLATNRTGTMENELQSAGKEGFRVLGLSVGETLFGGKEVLAILQKTLAEAAPITPSTPESPTDRATAVSTEVGTSISIKHEVTANEIVELQTSAEEGDAEAQWKLGLLYREGLEVLQNYEQAIAWLSRASDQGHVGASFELGFTHEMLSGSAGLVGRLRAAIKYYLLAAQEHHVEAMIGLGRAYYAFYQNEALVEPDGRSQLISVNGSLASSHMWYNLATLHSSGEVRITATSARAALERQMSNVTIFEAQRLAREWAVAHPRDP